MTLCTSEPDGASYVTTRPPRVIHIPITKILFLLLLGGITTLCVAWGSAAWRPIRAASAVIGSDGDHLRPWLIRLEEPGAVRTIWFEKGRVYNRAGVAPAGASSAAVACWSHAVATRNDPRTTKGTLAVPAELELAVAPFHTGGTAWGAALDVRGWPLPALRARIVGVLDPQATEVYLVEDGIELAMDTSVGTSNSLADVRQLPLAPVWTGLVVNTAVFAALWWVVLLIPGGLVRIARGRRGACPSCGYDLRGSLDRRCPECGWGCQTSGQREAA
jgi:hypothetical protein